MGFQRTLEQPFNLALTDSEIVSRIPKEHISNNIPTFSILHTLQMIYLQIIHVLTTTLIHNKDFLA